MIDQELNEQERLRREKLAHLRAAGVNPYPSVYERSHGSHDILNSFTEATASEWTDVSVAGRIMTFRRMGKASFLHLQDQQGRIQVYLKADDLGEVYDLLKQVDIGDVIGVKGYVFITRTGEISVHAREFHILAKSLTLIPMAKEEKDEDGNITRYDAFADKEQRYRKRYLDLIANPEIKDTFVKRSRIISTMRRFFDDRGWLEVETPVLQPIYGGATARPFITHHNALNIPLYLRIADELYLKRLIVGGFDGVYEISKNFRNEGMDKTHNPEFTMMEIYVAYKDYEWMMGMTEEMISTIVNDVCGGYTVTVGEREISFAPPFRRAKMFDLFKEYTGMDLRGKSREELVAAAREIGVPVDPSWSAMKLLDEIFGNKVEHELVQPTFVIDYPVEMSPLAKAHRTEAGLVERFELFVNGKELANSFSELNDPIDQRQRLEEQAEIRAAGDDEAMIVDEDFLHAIEVGMPPTAGLGVGVDRLVMLLTNNDSIRDVLFFPTMRPERTAQDHGA